MSFPPPLPPLSGYLKNLARAAAQRQQADEDEAAKPRPPAGPVYFCGLDLGQTHDPTAFVMIERNVVELPPPTETPEQVARRAAALASGHPLRPLGPVKVRRYAIRNIHRWPLRTSYPDIVASVTKLFEQPPLKGSILTIDGTGCGRPVVQMFTHAKERIKARIVPIVIHGGAAASVLKGWRSVPRRDLAGVLQVVLGTRRLDIAPELPLAKVLLRELETFTTKINIATGNESWEAWRSKDTDDVTLSAAMALWYAEVLGGDKGRAIIV